MNLAARVAAIAAVGLALGGAASVGVNELVSSSSPAEAGCNDWVLSTPMTQRECFGAGTILIGLDNGYQAGQWCKWQAANPGEWSRLQAYAANPVVPPANIISWFGGWIYDQLQAYTALGAPPFTLSPTPAPNRCKTPTLAAPVVGGVTPGPSTVTVTVNP